jgi:hypothetical protein
MTAGRLRGCLSAVLIIAQDDAPFMSQATQPSGRVCLRSGSYQYRYNANTVPHRDRQLSVMHKSVKRDG